MLIFLSGRHVAPYGEDSLSRTPPVCTRMSISTNLSISFSMKDVKLIGLKSFTVPRRAPSLGYEHHPSLLLAAGNKTRGQSGSLKLAERKRYHSHALLQKYPIDPIAARSLLWLKGADCSPQSFKGYNLNDLRPVTPSCPRQRRGAEALRLGVWKVCLY